LSATVAEPDELRRWLVPQRTAGAMRRLVTAAGAARAEITMLDTARAPALGRPFRALRLPRSTSDQAHKTTLVFVNTRSQAEMLFQELWRINEDNLPIALHHGSLDVAQRRKVEAAMAAGKLRAIVVCTSTLDLGIDWGDVDLVINVGAPKGASRAAAAHRPRQPPARRAVARDPGAGQPLRGAGMPRRARGRGAGAQDTPPLRTGALDVLAQHVLGWPAPSRSMPTNSTTRCAAPRPMRDARPRDLRRASSISSPPAAMR
jgi:ATP-dependent helicase Lhr and Lhr-like helicase